LTAALDVQAMHSVAQADLEPGHREAKRVGAGFIASFGLAYTGFWISVLTPGLIALPLKARVLVGPDQAASVYGLTVAVITFVGMICGPLVGKMSDRTTARFGMRRPYIVIGAIGALVSLTLVALAPSVPVLVAAAFLYGLIAAPAGTALVGALPDQVPSSQRGTVSGILGLSLPVGLILGTSIVGAVSPNLMLMFVVPQIVGTILLLQFVFVLKDRRLRAADRPAWSSRELATTFWISPRKHPDFAWVFASRFLMVLAYAFLTGFQTFYLLNKIGTPPAEVASQVALATLVLALVTIVSSAVAGRLSDVLKRRKVFVISAALIYGVALAIAAGATEFNGFLVAMAVAGIGFGAYVAVDLALVTDVLPNPDHAAAEMGVFNIASNLPQTLAPAIAPVILLIGSGSYTVLYAVGAAAAVVGALAVLPVRKAR
jgi:MFS family permease